MAGFLFRRFLLLTLCAALCACGKGSSSQTDSSKGNITEQQITDRQTTDLTDAAHGAGVSKPQQPNPPKQLSIDAGPDIYTDSNLMVNLQGRATGELGSLGR